VGVSLPTLAFRAKLLRVSSREERKAQRAAEGEALVALAAAYKAMTPEERVAQASRSDLTDNEQLALAAFADDLDVADALLGNPHLCDAALGVAHAMRRRSGPWWRRLFGAR
jgi:hypothetical protein